MKKITEKILKKLICSIILAMLLVNSNLLIIISRAVDGLENQQQDEKAKATIQAILEKYCNYNLSEDNKGVLVQLDLKTGINFQEEQEYKPLKSTEVNLTSPNIEGEYPERVEVIAKSTKATNGKENNAEANYEYNNENGEIKIFTSNDEDENGNIYNENNKTANDEYKVIYYYKEI